MHEKRASTAALDTEVTEISKSDTLNFNHIKVHVIDVNHLPVRNAFGFIFETSDARVAISGDTTHCPALIRAAEGVDMLIHELLIHCEFPIIEGMRSAETVTAMQAYHTVSDQVGKVASEADAGKLVLTHFVPPKFDEKSLLDEVRRDFDGPIIIGADFMKLSVS